jgi:hypothetical protein
MLRYLLASPITVLFNRLIQNHAHQNNTLSLAVRYCFTFITFFNQMRSRYYNRIKQTFTKL